MGSEHFDGKVATFKQDLARLIQIKDLITSHLDDRARDLADALTAATEELQVASEELLEQNEELLRTREVVEFERWKYQDLFESAPDSYLVTDMQGVILQVNHAAETLINVPRNFLVGKPLTAFLRGNNLKRTLKQIETLRESNTKVAWETILFPRNREPGEVSIHAGVQKDTEGNPLNILWIIHNLSSQKQMERDIQERDARLQAIFEAADLGIALLALDGRILESNTVFQQMTGNATVGVSNPYFNWLDMYEPDPSDPDYLSGLASGRIERYKTELLANREKTHFAWMNTTFTLLRNSAGQPQYILSLMEDITSRKRMETELIEVEHQLENASELERSNLAHELHDGPIQNLYGLIYRLKVLSFSQTNQEVLTELELIRENAQQVIDMLRLTTGMLRPPSLSTFGLEKAMQSYGDQILLLHPDLEITYDLPDTRIELSERSQVGIFRIFQHSLLNVVRHSRAKTAIVRLCCLDDSIQLEVEDDGVGFMVPTRWVDLVKENRYGLVGAAERAASMGGSLRLRSEPGKGTLVRLIIPRAEEEQRKKSLAGLSLEIPVC